jgi:hypothetical protein
VLCQTRHSRETQSEVCRCRNRGNRVRELCDGNVQTRRQHHITGEFAFPQPATAWPVAISHASAFGSGGVCPAHVLTVPRLSDAMEPPIVVNPEEEPLETLRNVLQYAYPAVLLFAFIVVGATDSIIAAVRKDNVEMPTVTGPGGKPLPVTKRKRQSQDEDEDERYSPASKTFFRCCMMLATFTFFCAGANVAARALYNRTASGGHGWWCGEPKTVRS